MAAKARVSIISLDEDALTHLSETIHSYEGKRILKALSTRSRSEAELTSSLGLSISSVHKVLGYLLAANVVESVERKKGKRGPPSYKYKVRSSPVVVIPALRTSVGSKIKRLLPIIAIVTAVAGLLQLVSRDGTRALLNIFSIDAEETAVSVAATTPSGQVSFQIAPWFLVGAVFSIIIFIVYDYWKEGRFKAKQ